MLSGKAMPSLLQHILHVDPRWGGVFLSKVYLKDAYTRAYILPEDLLQLTFFILSHLDNAGNLIGFHLSLPLRYIDSALYSCYTSEITKYLDNNIWDTSTVAAPHPLPKIADIPASAYYNTHSSIITETLDTSLAYFTTSILPPDSIS